MSRFLLGHVLPSIANYLTYNVIHDHNAKNDGKLFEDEERTSDVRGSDLANIGRSS